MRWLEVGIFGLWAIIYGILTSVFAILICIVVVLLLCGEYLSDKIQVVVDGEY